MRLASVLPCLICIGCWHVAAAADLSAIADTHVQTDAATTNYGGSSIVAVAANRTGLIRFDPAAVAQASGATASLKIKVQLIKNTSNAVTIRLVQGPWSESTVTARTLPSLSAPIAQKTVTSADVGKFITFDISSVLAGWKSNPATNFGIAIAAATPVPNLQFGSREGGSAAALTIDGAGARNQVKVAAVGGDYTNPVAAASNALSGDHWCVTAPCTMTISAGNYILAETLVLPFEVKVAGDGMGETALIAAKGLGVAVRSHAQSLTDLSIINSQDTGPQAIGLVVGDEFDSRTLTLARLSILASGASQNSGMSLQSRSNVLTDLRIAGRGGRDSTAAGSLYTNQRFTRCTLEASGAYFSNTGFVQGANAPGEIEFVSSSISALGGEYARGGEFLGMGAGVSATDTTISANADQATGLYVYGASNSNVTLLNSNLIAIGRVAATGLQHDSSGATALLDGVHINATTVGIANGSAANSIRTTLVRTQITADSVGVQLTNRNGADISRSTIKGLFWFEGSAGTLTVNDSVLDGDAVYGSTHPVCARVYNKAYQFLASGCPAP